MSLIDETGDLGGPANLLLIPCRNLFSGIAIVVIIFFVIRRFRSNEIGYLEWSILLFAVAFIASVVLNKMAIDQISIDDQLFRFFAFGGNSLLLAPPTYWFVYEMIDAFPTR